MKTQPNNRSSFSNLDALQSTLLLVILPTVSYSMGCCCCCC